MNEEIKDNTLALLYDVNSNVNIAISLQLAKLTEKPYRKLFCGGMSLSLFSVATRWICFFKECLEENKYLYKYKGVLDNPSFGMVYDSLCVSVCGHQISMMNAFINHNTHTGK